MQNVYKWLFIGLGLAAFFAGAAAFYYFNGSETESLKDAYDLYRTGELATSPEEKKNAFNQSLQIYKSIEKKYAPQFGNGTLYYNIGNTYFQLEEYPMALLYYYKSLQQAPSDPRTTANITVAKNKLGLSQKQPSTVWQSLFFFHYQWSLGQRLQLLSLLVFFILGLWSAYIWNPKKWLFVLLVFSGLFFLLMANSVLYSAFISPVEGIAIKGSYLYRDAGTQYATVSQQPVPAGTKVFILSTKQNGEWIKVVTPDEQVGYVQGESIKII